MTVALGYVHERTGQVWLGFDAGCDLAGLRMVDATKKLLAVEDLLVAVTGSKALQDMAATWCPPEAADSVALGDSLANHLWNHRRFPAVRSQFDDGEALWGGFLVAGRGRLWRVVRSCSFHEPADRMWAIGSGEELAMGAMAAFMASGLADEDPERAVTESLRIAARYRGELLGPFDVRSA